MKEVKITNQLKKDLKRYQNQPKRINKLKVVLEYLQQGTAIPQEYKPHKLLGEYKDCMECHIESDTLLIWFDLQISPQQLLQRLLQNGSGAADVHSGEAFAFGAEGGAFYEAEARFPDKKFG